MKKTVLLIGIFTCTFIINAQDVIVNDRTAIVKLTKEKIDFLVEHFCMDRESRNYGGFVYGDVKPYADTRGSVYQGQYLFVAYLYPDFPEYYNQPETFEKLRANIEFMLRRQRPNGSISLGTKSIGGPNEVGFSLPGLIKVYQKLKASNVNGKKELMEGLEVYIKKGAERIRNGFPYTSNHRWAANCAPLAMADSIFSEPGNEVYIEEYLSDGIDMDDKGMYYEERSPHYNEVANNGLIILADYWDRKDFLDLVALNLNYNLAMRQPSGEVETMFSHRQDRGSSNVNWGDYTQYKRLAIEKNNGVFARAADLLLQECIENHDLPGGSIPAIFLFDDENMVNDRVIRKSLPENYIIRFEKNPIWRYRTKDVGVTLAADKGGHWWDITQGTWKGYQRSDVFMDYHFRDAIIDAIRIRWVDGNDSFHPENIEYLENGSMRMVYDDPGWDHVAHFRPRDKWGPRRIEGHNKGEVIVTPMDSGKFSLNIQITGWEDVHTNIQLLLREDCKLINPEKLEVNAAKSDKSFSMSTGNYYLVSPAGNTLKISGVQESEHVFELGDQHHIETSADDRCHKFIIGLYTPVNIELVFEPVY